MIRHLCLTNFRGIRAGTLDGFAPLTVLVGSNGCGKSTVLDALLLGATSRPLEAFARVLERRPEVENPARWLFFRGDYDSKPVISVSTEQENAQDPVRLWRFVRRGTTTLGFSILKLGTAEFGTSEHQLEPGLAGPDTAMAFKEIPDARLVVPAAGRFSEPLHVLLSRAIKEGHSKQVHEILSQIIEGLESIQVLILEKNPEVHVVFDWGSIPLGVTGDGIYGLARLAFELAMKPGSLALVEEPEVNQHPRALRMSARVIWAAVRSGVQVVVSTHSLELIDLLLDEGQTNAEVAKLAVCRLQIDESELKSVWSRGEEIVFERRQIEEELR